MTKHLKNPKSAPPKSAEDQARLIVALVLSLVILFGFNYIFAPNSAHKKAEQQVAEKQAEIAKSPAKIASREDVLAASGRRIKITGDKVTGSLPLKGGRLDDLLLKGHYTTVEKKDNVPLLIPTGAPHAYYLEAGWIADDAGVKVPGANDVWSLAPGSATEITSAGKPVVLQWSNGQGLTFERAISLDKNYLFTVTERVRNNGSKPVTLNAYQAAARQGLPEGFSGFFVLHEGPIGFLNKELEDPAYKDLFKGDKITRAGVSGWLGMTDKYWMVALLPKPGTTFNARMVAQPDGPQTIYQTDAVLPAKTIAPGESVEETVQIYAGVKDLSLIQSYQQTHGFDQLELSMDFGMWYFITKPFYYLLHLLQSMAGGSIAVAILLMTVIVRSAVFPLASKSFRSMAKMRIIAPQMKELQDKYKGDKQRLQMEIFELYKREDVNPFSGCWPIIIQIPIFFALYKVILISVELRHAPFWGWVHDLSAPDPTTLFNLFGLLPFTPPQMLMIGGWPILFCLSMVMQQRISPPPTDPTQEMVQQYFPFFITFMMAHFAVGLVIYWTWSNVLGTLQQYYILKKVGGEETSLIRGHASRRKKKKTPESGKA